MNTATDFIVLGETGARDPEWAESVKARKLEEQVQLQVAGERKKALTTVPFAVLRNLYEVRQHSSVCRFEGAKGVACPPGDARTRGKLFGSGLVWTGGGRTGAVRGQLTGYDAYPPTYPQPTSSFGVPSGGASSPSSPPPAAEGESAEDLSPEAAAGGTGGGGAGSGSGGPKRGVKRGATKSEGAPAASAKSPG